MKVLSEKAKKEYLKKVEELKGKYEKIDTDETLKKYKILSKVYELGKKYYGTLYSQVTLSIEMDLPYTTVKRILSLRHANKNTWKLINDGKLSTFKAAMICMQVNKEKQDDVVKLVLKDNLSTYQIKKIRVYDEDPKMEKLQKAIESGFERKNAAHESIINLIHRLEKMLDINIDNFKKTELILALKHLDKKIKAKFEEWKK